jgi:hypothetical protein
MKLSYRYTKFCLIILTGLLIFSLSGCRGNSSNADVPLSTDNINLIFVVRTHSKITSHFLIPASSHIWPLLNHEFLKIACYSCGFAQSQQPNLT